MVYNAHIAVYNKEITVFHSLLSVYDLDQGIHEDVRGQHAHQAVSIHDFMGNGDDDPAGVCIPVGGGEVESICIAGSCVPVPFCEIRAAVRHISGTGGHVVVGGGEV